MSIKRIWFGSWLSNLQRISYFVHSSSDELKKNKNINPCKANYQLGAPCTASVHDNSDYCGTNSYLQFSRKVDTQLNAKLIVLSPNRSIAPPPIARQIAPITRLNIHPTPQTIVPITHLNVQVPPETIVPQTAVHQASSWRSNVTHSRSPKSSRFINRNRNSRPSTINWAANNCCSNSFW